MKTDCCGWLQKIEYHAKSSRKERPIPERNGLSPSQLAQLHIIKGALLHQLNLLSSDFAATRDQHNKLAFCLVFTSSLPGLVAAREISSAASLPIFHLFPEEMNSFLQLCPDPAHAHHVHVWSHFLEELDSQAIRFASRYPLSDDESYWLHVEGIHCSPKRTRGAEHLWSWDGVRPKLLKKNLFHWST